MIRWNVKTPDGRHDVGISPGTPYGARSVAVWTGVDGTAKVKVKVKVKRFILVNHKERVLPISSQNKYKQKR